MQPQLKCYSTSGAKRSGSCSETLRAFAKVSLTNRISRASSCVLACITHFYDRENRGANRDLVQRGVYFGLFVEWLTDLTVQMAFG